MLTIGNIYISRQEGQSRLCADIALNGKGTTLWFSVPTEQEAYLCQERSDAFVMALLPTAMRGGYDITCHTPMSRRLHYQLEQYLIPSLCAAGALYHPMSIYAPLAEEPVPNRGAVATGFSAGVDSLYTIMSHGSQSDYPLTHLTVFNTGFFQGHSYRKNFHKACEKVRAFAEDTGLSWLCVDSNIQDILPEQFLDVYSFRTLACAMALQRLFRVYLLSSGHDFASFHFDLHNSATYDMLTVSCAQTESLRFYLSGAQLKRWEKLESLSRWPRSYTWLHPCVFGFAGEKNCGRCKKCIRTQTDLYALGTLDRYETMFDVPAYKKALPQRIGFILANRGNNLFDETRQLLEQRQIPIPLAARIFEQQFLRSMENLKASLEEPQTGK